MNRVPRVAIVSCLFLFFSFFIFQDNVFAADYYLSVSGNDTNLGTAADNAWETADFACPQLQAGDILYVEEGTYIDQHCSLANSGIEGSPIVITGYSGNSSKPIFDGVTKAGDGIYARDKNNFAISGVVLKNYQRGIYLQADTSDVELKNFEISDCSQSGIEFVGIDNDAVHDISIHDFKMLRIGGATGTSAAGIIHEFGLSGSYDIDIYNFDIRDAVSNGGGMKIRETERLHIHDGGVYDLDTSAAQIGIVLGQKVNNSIVENVTVINTGWSGISLYAGGADTVTPDKYLYNNIIRNCTVGFPHHNAIDLHTGTVNTLIENVTLYGNALGLQGINYMSLGTGLEVRNADITGLLTGMYLTQPNASVRGIITHGIEQGSIYITQPNISVYDSDFSESSYSVPIIINTQADNYLIDNSRLGEGKTIVASTGSGTLRDVLDSAYDISKKASAVVDVEYTDNRIFTLSANASVSAPIYTAGHSYVAIDGPVDTYTEVSAYPAYALPAFEHLEITVSAISQSSDTWDFTVSSSVPENPTIFTIDTLTANAGYSVRRDGVEMGISYTDNDGKLVYTYQLEGSEFDISHRFQFVPTEIFASASYPLTVAQGSGSGYYTQGYGVAVVASSPAAGKVFDRWTGDTTNVSDVNAASVIVTMPDSAIGLTATYKDDVAQITSFTLIDPAATGIIDETNHTISLTIPFGTDDTSLIPNIAVSAGATVSPASAAAQNFNYPVSYTVTAADNSTQSYVVTVRATPNPAKAITSFNLNKISPAVMGVVDETNHTIALTVPYGTDITALAPSVTLAGIRVVPASGSVQDFTGPLTYVVTAADFSTQSYVVTVTEASGSVVAPPLYSLAPSVYAGAQTVAITSLTSGASIYYTTDNTAPSSSSNLYSGVITVSSSVTFKAIAIKAGMTDSAVSSAAYTINTSSGGGGGSSSGGGSGGSPALTPVISKIEIASVTDNKVNLALSVTNASFMMLSDSSSFTGATWIPYQTMHTYTKSDTQTKLYLKFKSSTNIVSAVTEMTIAAGSTGGGSGTYPNGTLLKIPASFKVYVMIENKKKWIPTPEVFQQLGYAWTEVKELTQDQLNLIPDFEDNLIRALGNYKVYLVVNGVKRHIPNPEVFLNYGFLWEDVVDIPQETVDKYKNTYLIKESGKDGVYYINASEIRKLIPSTEVFNSYNDKTEDIQVISNYEMNYYPNSNLIKLGGSSDIYLIEGTTKKRIPSPAVFSKYKLNWNLVMSVNETEFNFYQDGGELK